MYIFIHQTTWQRSR